MLVVLSGLPGVGKSTIARALARDIGAAWLRIDVIEQAIKEAGLEPGPAGYLVGYALARANIAVGHIVVADSANPLCATRAAWRRAGQGVRVIEVEIVCSDPALHRSRVEERTPDVAGLRLPRWSDVVGYAYEPWTSDRLVVDTAAESATQAVARIRAAMGGDGIEPPANSV